MTVGERIQVARKNAGIKQSELAEKLGVAVITIGQYERGKRQPRLEQLQRIATALGVSVDYLLGQYHLKGIIDYKSLAIRERIFERIKQQGMSYEEFCKKLGLPFDEWFHWKEESSESYLDHLPQIAELLNIPESELVGEYRKRTVSVEAKLKKALIKLNDKGKQEAVKRVEELTEIPKYQRHSPTDAPESPDAAQDGKDTIKDEKLPTGH